MRINAVVIAIFYLFSAVVVLDVAQAGPFAEGLKKYEGEFYGEAYQRFLDAAAINPQDNRIKFYLARTAYKLKRDGEALKYFSKVPKSQMTPDSHYEFGQSLLKVGNYGPAYQHFTEVPKGHPLADLASYFAGFCAVKSRKYPLAEKKFNEAVILPAKLAERRKMYLQRLQKISKAASSRKKTTIKPNIAENQQAVSSKRLTVRKKRQIDRIIKQTSSIAPAYKHKGYEAYKKKAVFGIDYAQQNSDFHGAQSSEVKYQTVYFDFRNGFEGNRKTKFKNQHMVYGAQIEAKAETRSSDGEEQRNIVFEEGSDRFRTTANPFSGNGRTNNLVAKFRPYLEVPVGEDLWLGFSAYYTRNAIDIDFGEGGGDHGFYLNGYLNRGAFALGIKGDFDFTRNSSHDQMSRSTAAEVYSDVKLGADTTLSPSIKYQSFVYRVTQDEGGNNVFIAGPDSAVVGVLELEQRFPLGISLAGELVGSYKDNYVTRVSASQAPILTRDTEFSASAAGLALKASLEASPIKWLTINAEYSYAFDRYSVDDPEEFPNKVNIYEDFTPNIISGFMFGVGVNLLF